MPTVNHGRARLRVLLVLGSLIVAGLSAITSETSAQAATCTWTPFTSKSSARYRLPAVVKADNGRIFVFAERRNNNYDNDDQGDFDIVMRTSVNGGCTWGKLVTVADWGTNKVSNPVPIYDRAHDQVLLFSTVKLASGNKLYLQKISATGTSISSLRSGAVSVDGWFPGLTGPGHGLVLSHGAHAGRIIFAMGYTRGSTRTTRAIYSDDAGKTWRVGFDRPSPGSLQLIEGTLAELPDGRLLVSYRDNGRGVPTPGRNRVSAMSTDGGQTVSSYGAMTGIKTVPVQGSLLQAGSYLLFSSPAYLTGSLTSRRGLRVFVSTNSGATWKRGVGIGPKTGSTGYSDLVQLNAATVGVVYEADYVRYWTRIRFAPVRLSSIATSLLPKVSVSKRPSTVGSYRSGYTVRARHGRFTPAPASYRYQWLRDGKPIPKATGSRYRLRKADRYHRISVRVTAVRGGYRSASATSVRHAIR